MGPREVTDANGNRTRYAYNALGLLASVAVMGKEGEDVGDAERPGTRYIYDFSAFRNRGQPISVRTIRHVHHQNSSTPQPAREETIEQLEYSDGFGRLVQTRAQAEDTIFGKPGPDGAVPARGDAGLPLDQSQPPVPAQGTKPTDSEPNVTVSAWKVYDNKGRVVESYEPFFDRGWSYRPPTAAQRGESTRTHYDPRGQVTRVVYPEGSEQRVVHGVPLDFSKPDGYRPTPWEAYTYDRNDNAGRTHATESKAYDTHWDTPSSAIVDALGRIVGATERVGPKPATEWFVTRTHYDIRGNVLSVVDPLGRPVVSSVYDLANRALRSDSLDAGAERTVLDVAGQPLERRTATGALAVRRFDLLGRPLRVWARDRLAERVTLRERIEYGDGSDPNQPKPARDSARAANTLGRAVVHFDEAGRLFRSYDFKGSVLAEGRRVIADTEILKVFSAAPPEWKVPTYRVSWEPPRGTSFADHAKTLLEPDGQEHTTSMAYDALNRVTTLQYPRDATGTRRKLDVAYNRGGAPERLVLDGTPFVRRIAYNARGQRLLVVYGNGLMTRHGYDPKTFRLGRTRTERVEGPGEEPPYKGTGATLQELGYRYDLAGNVLSIDDRTRGAGVENTSDGPDRLLREFEYDALYQLTAASGRVCTNIGSPRPWGDVATCGFGGFDHGSVNQGNAPKLTRRYDERYRYDAAGTMLSLAHHPAGATGWTRRFGVGGMKPADWDAAWRAHLDPNVEWAGAPSNRLTHVGDAQTHFFDEGGNLIRQLTSSHYEWYWAGRMRAFRVQVPASGSDPSEDRWAEPSSFTHYLYDSAGQRVKKLTRHQGGQFETATYIGTVFEAHRFRDGNRGTTLHLLDGDRRVASRRVGDAHPDDRSPDVKYRIEDHVGSIVLVVDQGGGWVNREEYSPYGDTTLGGFAKKRYRFSGKERDEESGLCYHGARYYAPWLARWVSADPAGFADGLNLYTYARGNPIGFVDLTGRQSASADQQHTGVRTETIDGIPMTVIHIKLSDAAPLDEPSLADELIMGDLYEGETTWGGVAGNVGIGLIPGVGQVADARDTLAAIKNVVQDPGSGKNWATLGMAGVGWWPGFGDFIKGAGKVGKKAVSEAVEQGTEAASVLKNKSVKETSETVATRGTVDFTAYAMKAFTKSFSETPELKRVWQTASHGLPQTREGFNEARKAFWKTVNEGADGDAKIIRDILEEAGYELRGASLAPRLKLMQGYDSRARREMMDRTLSIDHQEAAFGKFGNPKRSLDPTNLRFMSWRDNSIRGDRHRPGQVTVSRVCAAAARASAEWHEAAVEQRLRGAAAPLLAKRDDRLGFRRHHPRPRAAGF